MTTYNGRSFIESQVQSLLSQRRRPDEIVVGDDGSSDGTFEYLQSFARSAPVPFHVQQNPERLGWRANFMAVAGRCTGDLVAFCDQDDLWYPDKLSRMEAVFQDPRVQMAYHNATLIDDGDAPIGTLFGESDRTVTTHHGLAADLWASVLGFSIVFRRDVLRYNRYWEDSIDKLNQAERAPHDQWVQFIASVLGDITYVNEALVGYRLHGNNSMGYRRTAVTFRELVEMYRGSRAKVLDRRATTANRIALLERMAQDHTVDRPRLEAALEAYRAHLALNERRLASYDGKWVFTRMRRVLSMTRHGAYSSPTLPLSRKEVARDFAVALIGRSAQPAG
jgi:glycosyltransferase involved in cell wall biosynthesis